MAAFGRATSTRGGGIVFPQVAPGTSVPKIIHQNMFKGWDAVAPELVENAETLQARNPDWEYRFYDLAAAKEYIARVWGEAMLAVWESIDPVYYAARSDLLRYMVSYTEGGVYFDMKSTALLPLDEVIRPDDVFVLSQWPQVPNRSSDAIGKLYRPSAGLEHFPGGEYTQWFIVAAPGHPFLAAVITEVLERIARYNVFTDDIGGNGVLRLTGPTPYTLAIHPLLETAPHRFACLDRDLHFLYSIYGKHMGHRKDMRTHYMRATRPIVVKGPLTTAATIAWYAKLRPKIERMGKRLRSRTRTGGGASA